MGIQCGIVGLPNVGKSTLFNALTQTAAAQAANYPFCTIEPNVGEVAVPDTRLDALRGALSVLNPRERRIFEARRLAEDPITLEELAEGFGVSRERVRQIEVRAFEKVQKAVRSRVAAMETPSAPAAMALH